MRFTNPDYEGIAVKALPLETEPPKKQRPNSMGASPPFKLGGVTYFVHTLLKRRVTELQRLAFAAGIPRTVLNEALRVRAVEVAIFPALC